DCEHRTTPHHPEGVAHVARQIFDPARATRIPRLLFDRLESAKPRERLPPRFVGPHAFTLEAARVFADVVRELSVELALEPVAAHEPREPPHALLRLKNQRNRSRQAAPVRALAIEPRASLPREAVDLRGAAGVRFRPRRREQAAILEPVERRIERPLW